MTRVTSISARFAWLIVGFWVVTLAVLTLAVPQLSSVVARDTTPVVPDSAPAKIALAQMDREFSTGRTVSYVDIGIERASGLTAADKAWLTGLTARLAEDTQDVTFVQQLSGRPDILKALTSNDGKAAYVQIGTGGATGAPNSLTEIDRIRHLAHTNVPDGLSVALTGPAATIADTVTQTEKSIGLITIVTVVGIALILLLIYRSIGTMVLVLSFVGISLGIARQVAALCGLHLFAVSTFTNSFITATVLGAGTDYAIFLLARFHERTAMGDSPAEAAAESGRRVASVVIGSALTVVIANSAMAFADVGIYRTTGPAIAVSVFVTLLISLTLVPALLAIFGARGWVTQPVRTRQIWPAIGAWVVSRPVRTLIAGLIPLVLLAAFYPFLRPSMDEASGQPSTTESNQGLALLARHWAIGEVLPHDVLITSSHDLRTPKDLAAIEQACAALAKQPGVTEVRCITRPLGIPLTQASVGYQAGQVGDRLADAGQKVSANSGQTAQLLDGTQQLSDGTSQIATGAQQAVAGAGRLTSALTELRGGLSSLTAGARSAYGGSDQLRQGASILAAGLDTAYVQTQTAVSGLGQASNALQGSLACTLDPICTAARNGVRQVYAGERDALLPGLQRAAAAAHRLATGEAGLNQGLAELSAGLDTAQRGADQIAVGQQTMASKLALLAGGANQASDGAAKVHQGTVAMSGALTALSGGLSKAAAYLHQASVVARDPSIGGFYLPSGALSDPRLATATELYLSHDFRTARIFVLGSDDPYGWNAMNVARSLPEVTSTALRHTSLEQASVAVTGSGAIDADLLRMSGDDFTQLAIVSLIAVFVILLVLLRSLVAASFLLASVVLSFASAMGLGVLVFQVILGQDIEWTAQTIAFVLLVAVGADYNLLLTKRMHEEAPNGEPGGIARAVAITGSVITTAGVIFATSMFALMAGSVTGLAQTGFTIGCGLLIDTVVVRSMVVPAVATLLGPRLWWPGDRRRPTAPEPRREPLAV